MLSLITSLTGYPNLAAADLTWSPRASGSSQISCWLLQQSTRQQGDEETAHSPTIARKGGLLTSWGEVHAMGSGGRSFSVVTAFSGSEARGDVAASWPSCDIRQPFV